MILLLAAGSNSTSTLNDVEPGLLGFLVVAALGLALVFLLRSMNRQFRKIGPRPDDPEETEAQDVAAQGASDAPRQKPLRGLAAHRAAMAAAEAEAAKPAAEAPETSRD